MFSFFLSLKAPVTTSDLDTFYVSLASDETLSYLKKTKNISGYFTEDYYKAYSLFLNQKTPAEQKTFLNSGSPEANILQTFMTNVSTMKENDQTFVELKNAGFNPAAGVFKSFGTSQEGNLLSLQIVAKQGLGQIISKVAQLKTEDNETQRFNDFADKAISLYEDKNKILTEETKYIDTLVNDFKTAGDARPTLQKESEKINEISQKLDELNNSIQKDSESLDQMRLVFEQEKKSKIDSLLRDKQVGSDSLNVGFDNLFKESLDSLLQNSSISSDTKQSLQEIKKYFENPSALGSKTVQDLQVLEDSVQKVFEFKSKKKDQFVDMAEAKTLQSFKNEITKQKDVVDKFEFLQKIKLDVDLSDQMTAYNAKFQQGDSRAEDVAKVLEQEKRLAESKAQKNFQERQLGLLVSELNQIKTKKIAEITENEDNISKLEEEKVSIADKQKLILDLVTGGFKIDFKGVVGAKDIPEAVKLSGLLRQKPATRNEKLNLQDKVLQAQEDLNKIILNKQDVTLAQIASLQKTISEQDEKLNSILKNEDSGASASVLEEILRTKAGLMANLEVSKVELQGFELNKTIPDSVKKNLFDSVSKLYQTEITEKFATTISAKFQQNPQNKYFSSLMKASEILRIENSLKSIDKTFLLKPENRLMVEVLKTKKQMLENVKNPEDDVNLKILLNARTKEDFDKYKFETDKITFASDILVVQNKIKNINDKQKILTAFLQGGISLEDFPNQDVGKFKKDLLDAEEELRRIQAGVPLNKIGLSKQELFDLDAQNKALTLFLQDKNSKLDDFIKPDLTKLITINVDEKLLHLKPITERDVPPKNIKNKKAWMQSETEIRARKISFLELMESSKIQKNIDSGSLDLEDSLKLLKNVEVIEPSMLLERQKKLQENVSAGAFLTKYLMQDKNTQQSIVDVSDPENLRFSSDVPFLVQKVFGKEDELSEIKKLEDASFKKSSLVSSIQTPLGQKILALKDVDSMDGKNGGFSRIFSQALTGSARMISFSSVVNNFKKSFQKELEIKSLVEKSDGLSKKIDLPAQVVAEKTSTKKDVKSILKTKFNVMTTISKLQSNTVAEKNFSEDSKDRPERAKKLEGKLSYPGAEQPVNDFVEGDNLAEKEKPLSTSLKNLQAQIQVIEKLDSAEGKNDSEIARAKDALGEMKENLQSLSDSELDSDIKTKLMDLLDKPELADLGITKDSKSEGNSLFSKLIKLIKTVINPTQEPIDKAEQKKEAAISELNNLSENLNKILVDEQNKKDFAAKKIQAAYKKSVAQQKWLDTAKEAKAEQKRLAAEKAAADVKVEKQRSVDEEPEVIDPEKILGLLSPEKGGDQTKEKLMSEYQGQYETLYKQQQVAEQELQMAVGLNQKNPSLPSSIAPKTPEEIVAIRQRAKDATNALNKLENTIKQTSGPDAVKAVRAPIAQKIKEQRTSDDYSFPRSLPKSFKMR